jgi:hypothetical protein
MTFAAQPRYSIEERRGTLRWRRLKAVFEGRKRQLDEINADRTWPPTAEIRNAYAKAVIKYTRARTAWRAIRGWS